MDIGYRIDELVSKAKDDKAFAAKLIEDPIAAVRTAVGRNLSEDNLKILVEGVLSRMSEDYAGSVLGSIQKMF